MVDMIDLLGRKFGFDLQFVRFRNDLHNDLAGRDHAADGMDRKLVHNAVGRRPQVDPPEQILRGGALFDKLGLFVLGLAQILHDLRAKIVIDLDGLKF